MRPCATPPPLWLQVKCAGNRGWWKNFKQFLKLMLVGSRTRMLSVGTTAAFAVVLAQIANEQSCCREGLLHAIKRSKTTTAHELLKWFARDLGIIYLNAFVSYLAEAFNAFLVKQSSVLMWRQFYSQLGMIPQEDCPPCCFSLQRPMTQQLGVGH